VAIFYYHSLLHSLISNFIKQTYIHLIGVNKSVGNIRVFQESEFQNIAESASFKRQNLIIEKKF